MTKNLKETERIIAELCQELENDEMDYLGEELMRQDIRVSN